MGYGNGGTMTGTANQAAYPPNAPTPQMPLIALEMDRQEKALAHLHNVISDLENRLSSVTRGLGPETNGQANLKPPMAVPLAGNLSDGNSKIEAACARLQSIFDRIEL